MTFTYTPSFRHFGSPYKSLKSRSRRYELADEINTDYPKSGQKLPEIYFHAGLDCWGEVFPSGTSGYQREDELNLRWVEEDLWPNPDDKVAHWKNAETYSSGNVYLHETHHTTYGSPQESKTNLTTKPSGRNYYR